MLVGTITPSVIVITSFPEVGSLLSTVVSSLVTFTTPLVIVKVMSVATVYLLSSGVAASCIRYVPSGRPLTIVFDEPDSHVRVSVSETDSIEPSFPAVTLLSLKTISFPMISFPVSVISAPASSCPPVVSLLNSTVGRFEFSKEFL